MSMVPSMLRFNTPACSATSSPMAERRIGVAMRTIAASRATMNPSFRRSAIGVNSPDAIASQDVGGEQEHQRQPLDRSDQGYRHTRDDLHRQPAVDQRPEENGGDDHANRVQPAQQSNDDARE